MFAGLFDIFILINMILCFIIILWDTYFYFKVSEIERWSKILYVFVATCWLVRYLMYTIDYGPLGKSGPVNAPLAMLTTLTLLSLATGSVIRVQRSVGLDGLKQDIRRIYKRSLLWISRK